MWIWLREGQSAGYAAVGALLLVLYGVVPTFQPADFGSVYAAYGGVFVVLSLLWAWGVDGTVPDRFDVIGAGVVLVGIGIIMYAPRG